MMSRHSLAIGCLLLWVPPKQSSSTPGIAHEFFLYVSTVKGPEFHRQAFVGHVSSSFRSGAIQLVSGMGPADRRVEWASQEHRPRDILSHRA